MSPKGESPKPADTSLVLVCGDDVYEVGLQCRRVITGWESAFPDAESEVVDAQAATVAEVSTAMRGLHLAMESLSLFGTGKIVWFRGASFLGSEGRLAKSAQIAKALDSLLELLQRADFEKTRLLISCSSIDRRKRLYKWLNRTGSTVSCESLAAMGDKGEGLACRVVEEIAKQADKTMAPDLVEQLVRWVGLDRRALVSETEKVILYTGDRKEITLPDLDATVCKTRQAKAFAFADAVADRSLANALARLDEEVWSLRTDRQKSEMGLLYGLIAKFRVMIMVKGLISRRVLRVERSFARFRSQLGALDGSRFPSDRRYNPLAQNPYVLFRAAGQAGRYEEPELVAAMATLLRCNTRMVSVADDPSSLLRECVIDIILGKGM